MPRQTTSLRPNELAQAVGQLTGYLKAAGAEFRISGGAASTLIRMHYGINTRVTEDIDLVVQPTDTINAVNISAWLLQYFPKAFVAKTVYGVATPALKFKRSDGSVKEVEIEIFDVGAWPQRPQYDLSHCPDDVLEVAVRVGEGLVNVPVFSARWLLREKIITAFERQGSRKEDNDLGDACALLAVVEDGCVDLTQNEGAVEHLLRERPEYETLLQLKVLCPSKLGSQWVANEEAGVHWRIEGSELYYLDEELARHRFEWDREAKVWYLKANRYAWYYSNDDGDIILWGKMQGQQRRSGRR